MINITAPLGAMTEEHITDTFRANQLYKTKSKQELTLFYHVACLSPTKRTFVDAIKRNAFASWLGLTVELVKNYLQRTEATIKGHIIQHYKGTQSTRLKYEVPIMNQQSPPDILTEQKINFSSRSLSAPTKYTQRIQGVFLSHQAAAKSTS